MRGYRWLLPLVGVVALIVVGTTGASAQTPVPAGAPAGTGRVTAVHGLRGLVADVYLDGAVVLGGFSPERTTDALSVPVGRHRLDVRAAGDPVTSPPLVTASFDVPAGGHVSVVVHQSASGAPTATAFLNDLSAVAPGQSRLAVRNAAAAQPVDVRLDGVPLVGALANGREFAAPTSGAAHVLAVAPAGAANPVLGPDTVQLLPGSAYAFYLIGSQPDGSLGWIFEQFGGLPSTPLAISTGSGGTAGRGPGPSPRDLVAAGSVVLVSGLVFLRRRSSTPRPAA